MATYVGYIDGHECRLVVEYDENNTAVVTREYLEALLGGQYQTFTLEDET